MCEEILESLKRDDERGIDRAQADLQDALYELNREVRLQYEDEEDDDFFGAIRRTFTGEDDDDDYGYDSRRPGYRDNYRDDYRRDDYRRDDYRRDDYRRDDYGRPSYDGGSYYDRNNSNRSEVCRP